MISLSRQLGSSSPCGYLPEQRSRLEFEEFLQISPEEYRVRMDQGWRRFGRTLFRPRCRACSACQPLRVDVARFRPDRSQRRTRKQNEGTVRLRITEPSADPDTLDLYHRYHAFQEVARDWPSHADNDAESFIQSFLDNPFPTWQCRYEWNGRLIGTGFVDNLPAALSAIYFVYDPDYRDRSLGTWNILSLIDHAKNQGIPFVYLGYYIAGCRSMAYKSRFLPNQVLGLDGKWRDFRTRTNLPPNS